RILARFHYALRDGGYLFLGRSESLLARSRLFSALQLKWRIFQRISTAIPAVSAVLPEGLAMSRPSQDRASETSPLGLRVQRALDSVPSALTVVDAPDPILPWNPAAEALFETAIANAIGRKFRDLDVSYRVEGLRARMEDVKSRQASVRMDALSFTRRSGEL